MRKDLEEAVRAAQLASREAGLGRPGTAPGLVGNFPRRRPGERGAGEVRRPHISPANAAPSPPSTAGASRKWRPVVFNGPALRMGRMAPPKTGHQRSARRDRPRLRRDIVKLEMVRSIEVNPNGVVDVTVSLTTLGCPIRGHFQTGVYGAVRELDGVRGVNISFRRTVRPGRSRHSGTSSGVARCPRARSRRSANVICIGSGKGGVGKSSVTANIAAALTAEGKSARRPRRGRVGLLRTRGCSASAPSGRRSTPSASSCRWSTA